MDCTLDESESESESELEELSISDIRGILFLVYNWMKVGASSPPGTVRIRLRSDVWSALGLPLNSGGLAPLCRSGVRRDAFSFSRRLQLVRVQSNGASSWCPGGEKDGSFP